MSCTSVRPIFHPRVSQMAGESNSRASVGSFLGWLVQLQQVKTEFDIAILFFRN